MYRKIIAAIALVAFSAAPAFARGTSSSSTMPTCKSDDPVVWVNTSSKVYHMSGDKYYGKTKHGMYQCESAAKADGDKMASSGTLRSKAQPNTSPSSGQSSATGRRHRRPKPTPEPSPA
ncbi:hypothetical protein EPN42_06590 [bacterium]|nr:MAG: hypothetical protein EPN42_06590 [bacterium]